jgi:hypothetical protein
MRLILLMGCVFFIHFIHFSQSPGVISNFPETSGYITTVSSNGQSWAGVRGVVDLDRKHWFLVGKMPNIQTHSVLAGTGGTVEPAVAWVSNSGDIVVGSHLPPSGQGWQVFVWKSATGIVFLPPYVDFDENRPSLVVQSGEGIQIHGYSKRNRDGMSASWTWKENSGYEKFPVGSISTDVEFQLFTPDGRFAAGIGRSPEGKKPSLFHWSEAKGFEWTWFINDGVFSPLSISSDGSSFVGTLKRNVGYTGYYWNSKHGLIRLERPAEFKGVALNDSFASRITPDGAFVVGFFRGYRGELFRFMWPASGNWKPLETPLPDIPEWVRQHYGVLLPEGSPENRRDYSTASFSPDQKSLLATFRVVGRYGGAGTVVLPVANLVKQNRTLQFNFDSGSPTPISLSWPTNVNASVQATTNLLQPDSWTVIDAVVEEAGPNRSIKLPPSRPNEFFRLKVN